MSHKYMKVERIEHGTVIDHRLPAMAFDVLGGLGLSSVETVSIVVMSHAR